MKTLQITPFILSALVGLAGCTSPKQTETSDTAVSGPEDTSLAINLKDEDKLTTQISATGSYQDYKTRKLGEIEFPEAGEYQLQLRGVKEDWQPVNIRSVTLTPSK